MQSMWKGGELAEYNEPHLYFIGMVNDLDDSCKSFTL